MNTLSEPAASAREAHLRDYWKVVSQGRYTIIAIFVAVVGLTLAWTFLQTPVYRSTAIVEVQPQARRLMSAGDVSGMGAAGYGWLAEEKYHNTQIEIIKSRDVARRTVAMLGLDSHPNFAKHPDPVEAFRARIEVAPRRDTGLLEISIRGQNRDEITQWVNAVAQIYVSRNFEKAQENVRTAVSKIREEMSTLGGELEISEEARIGELENAEIFDSEGREELLRQQNLAINKTLTEVRIELDQLAQTLLQIKSMQQQGLDLLSLPELEEDETLREHQRDKLELERKLESSKVELRAGHPEYEKTARELEAISAKIDQKVGQVVAGLEARYRSLLTRRDDLVGQIRTTDEAQLEMLKKTSKYGILKTQADTKKQVFDLIAKMVNEVQMSAQLLNNNVTILDEANPPLFPVSPRKRVNVVIGAFLGLFCGLGAVFFLDYLDNTIRTAEDVERYLGLSVLGVVPKIADGGLAQRAVKEAYQSLRTSVIFSSKNRRRKVILITSTGPREGKSSTISNLGRTLAAAGDRVVIIDCDLRRPRQHVHFGVEREPGVTNYLAAPTHETDWSIYLRDVEPRGLQLLTCGPIPPSPPELLSNPRFAGLLAALREHYDWVLVDSPPAASLSDAALLASSSDMIIPVIQHNTTDRDHVIKMIQALRAVNPEIPGVVLNNVDLDRAYHKDYYYAGYYYEEDAPQPKRKRRAEAKAQAG